MNEKPDIMITIFGGNNQIGSVTATAVQNCYGDQGNKAADQTEDSEGIKNTEDREEMTDAELHLSVYVPDAKRLKNYVRLISECISAHELAAVVEGMLSEDRIDKNVVVKAAFIELLQPFAVRLTSGNSVFNIRQQINNMLAGRTRRKS